MSINLEKLSLFVIKVMTTFNSVISWVVDKKTATIVLFGTHEYIDHVLNK